MASKTIPLTQGYVALVDEEDYERCAQFKWHASVRRSKNYTLVYAVRRKPGPRGKNELIQMHHSILQLVDGQIDHRDNDGLNNQRSNLRAATNAQNTANARKRPGCSSRYRGVHWRKDSQKWIARVTKNGKRYIIGLFSKEEDAATAYNFAAIELFGEFVKLNHP